MNSETRDTSAPEPAAADAAPPASPVPVASPVEPVSAPATGTPPASAPPPASVPPPAPTPEEIAAFRDIVLHKLTYMVGKDPAHAQDHDWLIATARAVRDHVVDRWMEATRRTYRDGRRRV